MNKNLKFLFLSLTFILLIVSVGAISATDIDNSTTDTLTNSIENNVKDVEITKYSDNNNLLTENQEVNYYISDSNGNDNNTGTKESPYKTIQTALDKTTSESTYNIHILEGTYKGLGNTNLTVNGNYNINFIGDGINKTIIDGEVNYTITGASVWGQDDYWDYYNFSYGNWGMNITEGNGHITISNMNFQHMLTTAEQTRIEYNYLGTVTNYANLAVDNVFFYQNLGGLGAGIQNKANATLYVNNSIFQENRKSSGTGNFGAGVYNNGTAIIANSQFIKNAARWGTVTNDHIITVNNCTFRDGISYNLSSTYKYGSGFAYNTGQADFFNPYHCPTSNIITNCTFIRNGGTDIYANNGNLTVTGSQFINSTRIELIDSGSNVFATIGNYSVYITNNTFINPGYSSQDVSLSTSEELYAIKSSISDSNLTIENNVLKLINGTALEVYKGNIKNNTISFSKNGVAILLTPSQDTCNVINNTIHGGYINLRTHDNIISNNTITTDDTACIIFNHNYAMNNIIENNTLISVNSPYTITLYRTASNNIITNNYLESNSFVGDSAVLLARGSNTVVNNKPEAPTDGIFVNATATNIGEGTLTNPTTLTDALSKITNEKNKIYIINATGELKLNNPVIIDSTTVNTDNITITGYKYATISGNNKSQIMNIKDGYTVTISNITFKDAIADYGAIIYTEGNLTVLDSVFENSNANIAGGSIYANNNAVINLTNNTFNNIKSENETIFLNATATITNKNNKYNNCSINLINFNITSDTNNPNPIKVNDTVKFNISPVVLENPNFYDSDITDNITYLIYKDDEIVNTTTDNSYIIKSINPDTFTTYVQPNFTKQISNTISTDIYYPYPRIVTLYSDDLVVWANETITINSKLIDEFNLEVKRGTITYYNQSTQIGSSEVQNGVSTFILTIPTEGINTITLKYNDPTSNYTDATHNINLAVLENVYVSPNITEATTGLSTDPTTITDALTKITNNKKIIFYEGTYNINETITINAQTTTATNFTMAGENNNIILDGQNKTKIISITAGNKNIIIENLTFANANENTGAGIETSSILTLNNSKFINGYASQMGSAIVSYALLTIDNCEFINNTVENNDSYIIGQAATIYTRSNVNIYNSKFFNNTAEEASVVYVYRNNLTIINTTMDNNRGIGQGDGAEGDGLINIYGFTFGDITTRTRYLIIDNCTITNNQVSIVEEGEGGIIHTTGFVSTILTNNLFENNTSNTACAIHLDSNRQETTLINNTFRNIEVTEETNYFDGSATITLEGNTYENCTIGMTDLTIKQDSEITDLKVGDNVTININSITLNHPDWYDADILDDMSYEVYTNDILNSETEETTATVTMKSAGVVDVYAKTNFGNAISNVITFNVTQYGAVLTVDSVVAEVGDLVKLTARLSDENGNPINEGKVIFKVGGSTIKDENGKPIYGYVKNGVATIETTVQKGWTKENTIISTTYSGNNKYTSAKADNTVNVTYRTASIQILNDKAEYQSGSTIQLTAIVKDNHNRVVEDGIVLFKLNGVTLKDENGKAITATVSNGIAQITYSLGTLSVKNYTVTAVLSNKNFNKAEANSTFVILKGNIHVEVDAVRVTNNTSAVLTGKVFDGNNNILQRPVKVAVKINGITFATKVTVNNGTINIPLNESVSGSTSIDNFKMNRLYNILIIIGENNQYNGCNATTILIKQ